MFYFGKPIVLGHDLVPSQLCLHTQTPSGRTTVPRGVKAAFQEEVTLFCPNSCATTTCGIQ